LAGIVSTSINHLVIHFYSDISEKCNLAEFFEKNYIPVAPKLLPKNNTDSDNEDEEFTETEFEGLSDHYNDGEFF